MKDIYVFDFDGTLTKSDSMIGLIRHHKGTCGLAWALFRQAPFIVLMLMGKYDNQRCKERLLAHCFGGMSEEAFGELCRNYALSHPGLLRKEVKDIYDKAADKVVITASAAQWVGEFISGRLLASRLEIVNGKVTGKILGRNCYGKEKVMRLLEAFPDIKEHREDYRIIAYGDSKGDAEMLAFADEPHLL